ncbi:hypothetical protein TcCL_ESM00590 [Trypanosoma cruzi]|uniref:Transmembrane protein n=1 Tax=Trypanosoma cruzi (strain CL Brener) TaxID=353153 RepID=Q4DTF3_TRYCC|nr:hypothetical protein, conserved [Trypanosoma cruzi]EAN95804.1 hypothetical protein, conserved [Trypanosoma cruzi]RNC61739.1 hypothetical protein TcCL_ESM00590 [Trypanosoma cruzi]|eukprot:XP_817655.1 hypothetical protein [Trypanosoma cruzi strain CL Brener]
MPQRKLKGTRSASASPVTADTADGWVIVGGSEKLLPTPAASGDFSSARDTKIQCAEGKRIRLQSTEQAVNKPINRTDNSAHVSSLRNLDVRWNEAHSTSSLFSDEHSVNCDFLLRDRTRSSTTAAEEILSQQFEDNVYLSIPSPVPTPAAPSKGETLSPTADARNRSNDNSTSVGSFLTFFSNIGRCNLVNICSPMWKTYWGVFCSTIPLSNAAVYYCVFAAAAVFVVQFGSSVTQRASEENGRCSLFGLASRASPLVCVIMVAVGPLLCIGVKLFEVLFPDAEAAVPQSSEGRSEAVGQENEEVFLVPLKFALSSFLTFILLTEKNGGSSNVKGGVFDDHDGSSTVDDQKEIAVDGKTDTKPGSVEKHIRMSSLLLLGVGGGALSQYVIVSCS